MPVICAILTGVLFGAGLTLSDMVNPARVLNFLDIAGNWDPTLMFVMGGGLAVSIPGYWLIFRRGVPLYADAFQLPSSQRIDLPLVAGSALFGIGWGLAGICPGPAIADLVTLDSKVWLFVAAMLAGMLLAVLMRKRWSAVIGSRSLPSQARI
jgi:uncharacterized membrane protein YedE/YeeE